MLTIILILPLKLKSQGLQINEVVSKNYNGLESFENKTEDWIEIYNNSNDTIQLQNYFLSDDFNNLQAWQFPNIEMLPNSFLIIFASEKNIISPELHTNFKLKSEGEKLFLSNTNIVDSISIPSLKADFSYGRLNELSNQWTILDIPSPNRSNEFSNHLIFSHQSGFYDDDFQLSINSIKPNHTIHYTINGSEPTINSLIYSNNLLINDKSQHPNVLCNILTAPINDDLQFENISPPNKINKATVLKFASFYTNKKTSKTTTKDFFINKEHYQIPLISLSLDSNIFFDKDSGIYVPGSLYNDSSPLWSGNYFSKPVQDKNIHLTYFTENKELSLSQNASVKIHGGASRRNPQKSLRIKTSKKHGNQNLDEIFNIKNINKLILRATYSTWNNSIVSDYLINNSLQKIDIENSSSEPVIVYINGEYWGIHFLAKRIDKNFLKSKYNLKPEDKINILNYSDAKIIDGDSSSFVQLRDYVENNDLSKTDHYNYVSSKLDIDNFIDYHIIQLFFNNEDWPGNNCKVWNVNDSKWRFIFYDLDATFSNDFTIRKNMFEHLFEVENTVWSNPLEATVFFRKLIQNPNFKAQLISRYYDLLENEFSNTTLEKQYDKLMKDIPEHYDEHQKRWLNLYTYWAWNDILNNNILPFYRERQCYVNYHIEKTFEYNASYQCSFLDQANFLIYPNPAKKYLTIRQTHPNQSEYFTHFEIYNTSGSLIKSGILRAILENTISLDEILSGLYFLNIRSNTKIINQKFIVH